MDVDAIHTGRRTYRKSRPGGRILEQIRSLVMGPACSLANPTSLAWHVISSPIQRETTCVFLDLTIRNTVNLFNHRHETYGLVDRLDDINDTRNGILLYRGFQRP